MQEDEPQKDEVSNEEALDEDLTSASVEQPNREPKDLQRWEAVVTKVG